MRILALGAVGLAVVFGAVFAWVLQTGIDAPWLAVLSFGLCLGFGLLGVANGGLTIGGPVGLRIDALGLSGWYVPPVAWAEIVDIGPEDGLGKPLMGLRLHDFDGYVARQPRRKRMFMTLTAQGSDWDWLIPLEDLEGATPSQIVEAARAIHAQTQRR